MSSIDKNELLQQVLHAIHSVDPEAEVILFGSRARGNHHPDSDWDIYVGSDLAAGNIDVKFHIIDAVYDVETKFHQIITPVIRSKSSLLQRASYSFYGNIISEGLRIDDTLLTEA